MFLKAQKTMRKKQSDLAPAKVTMKKRRFSAAIDLNSFDKETQPSTKQDRFLGIQAYDINMVNLHLLPPDPANFELYPSTYARTRSMRLQHREVINAILGRIKTTVDKDSLEYHKFRSENEQRTNTASDQRQVNLRLMKTALDIDPFKDPDDFENLVQLENSCIRGTIEFEIALTMVIVDWIKNEAGAH